MQQSQGEPRSAFEDTSDVKRQRITRPRSPPKPIVRDFINYSYPQLPEPVLLRREPSIHVDPPAFPIPVVPKRRPRPYPSSSYRRYHPSPPYQLGEDISGSKKGTIFVGIEERHPRWYWIRVLQMDSQKVYIWQVPREYVVDPDPPGLAQWL